MCVCVCVYIYVYIVVVALGIISYTQLIIIYWSDRLSMDPKDVHVLILGTCKYVTSGDKRDFADMIKL